MVTFGVARKRGRPNAANGFAGSKHAKAMTPHQKQPLRPYNPNLLERHELKAIKPSTFIPSMEHNYVTSSSSGKRKPAVEGAHVHPAAGSRALHEYQFRPEQPSFRSETHERQPHSHCYDPAVVTPHTRVSSLPVGDHYLDGSEQVSPTYTFQGQLSSTSIPSQQGKQQFFSSGPADNENTSHSKSITNSATDAQFGMHQVLGSENPYLSYRQIFRDDDTSQVERKCKVYFGMLDTLCAIIKSLGDMAVYFGMLNVLLAAEELPEEYRDRCQVLLVDQFDRFVFKPLLYELLARVDP